MYRNRGGTCCAGSGCATSSSKANVTRMSASPIKGQRRVESEEGCRKLGGRRSATRYALRNPARSRLHIPELDQKDAAPGPMPGDLEKVDESHEAGAAGEGRSNVAERHLEERGHDDMPGMEGVLPPDLHVRPLPEPDAAGDLSVADSIAECLDELHGFRLTPSAAATPRAA